MRSLRCKVKSWLIYITLVLSMFASCSAGGDLPLCHAASAKKTKTVFAIWDKGCAELGIGAFAYARTKEDGTPDLATVKLRGLVLQSKCLRFEVADEDRGPGVPLSAADRGSNEGLR